MSSTSTGQPSEIVFTRKMGESIVVTTPRGDRVTFLVYKDSSTSNNRVKVKVTAPRDHEIFRSEVQDRIDAENPHEERR